jgi:hypothetical protein
MIQVSEKKNHLLYEPESKADNKQLEINLQIQVFLLKPNPKIQSHKGRWNQA